MGKFLRRGIEDLVLEKEILLEVFKISKIFQIFLELLLLLPEEIIDCLS